MVILSHSLIIFLLQLRLDELYLTMNVYDAGDYNNGSYWGYLRYLIQPLGDAENQYDNFEWPDGGYDSNPQVGKYPDGPVLQDIRW